MNDVVVLEVIPENPRTRDHELNRAVEMAIGHALGRDQEVLVTRRGFSHYTVTVSSDVPFGLIHEHSI